MTTANQLTSTVVSFAQDNVFEKQLHANHIQGHSSEHPSWSGYVPDFTSQGVFFRITSFNHHKKPVCEYNPHFTHEKTEFITCSKLKPFTLQSRNLNSVLSPKATPLNTMLLKNYCIES